jgi:hypothetical protein
MVFATSAQLRAGISKAVELRVSDHEASAFVSCQQIEFSRLVFIVITQVQVIAQTRNMTVALSKMTRLCALLVVLYIKSPLCLVECWKQFRCQRLSSLKACLRWQNLLRCKSSITVVFINVTV